MSDILKDVKAALEDKPGFEYAGWTRNALRGWLRALVERCENAEQERDTLRLATQSGCLDEMHLIATRNLPGVEAERDEWRKRCEAAEAALAQFQDFVRRERILRDNIGKGGQHVNGEAPSINPSVLHRLEWIIRDAPDVAKAYEALREQNHALANRATTAEASYQEAQLRIAGVEAERDHYRTALWMNMTHYCERHLLAPPSEHPCPDCEAEARVEGAVRFVIDAANHDIAIEGGGCLSPELMLERWADYQKREGR